MTADIPRPLDIHVVKTMPGFYSLGFGAYHTQVDNVCSAGTLTPPEGEDAGYYCPQAGTYNFHFVYDIFGDRNAWVRRLAVEHTTEISWIITKEWWYLESKYPHVTKCLLVVSTSTLRILQYGMFNGFSMGVAVHFKHEGGGSDYGSCHLKYKLKKSSDESFYTSVSFVGFALLGSGLLAGFAVRKRRQSRVEQDGDRQQEEIVTGFELARDHATV
jgi:hypothetical protein